MNIAFWGGCVNRQQNINAKGHHHALIKQFITTETGITPTTWLRFYSSFHELHREALLMLKGDKHYDYVVLFIRPFPLAALTKPLIRYTDKSLKNRFALHPRFSKHKYYNQMAKEYKVPVQANSKGSVVHTLFQQLNDFAGDMLSLPKWAKNEVISQLADIQAVAKERGTRVVLVGPMLYPASNRLNNICLELNRDVELFSSLHRICHVDLARHFDAQGNSFLESDGKHLTAAAHQFMAEAISSFITEPETTLKPVLSQQ